MTSLNLVAEPGKHDIVMSREFDAPRELVFRAYTDPVLLAKWWGPEGITVIVDQMDVRNGGVWRYVQRDADGNEYGFHGVYHQVIEPERIVSTFEFEGLPGHVLLETVTFETLGDKTRMTNSSVFQSVEDRDGMLQSGMEGGAAASWDRFNELLKTLA
jgi:uncharacterized protein YndB with AHSA1/START domain